jgi:hypothetical protein
MTDRTAEDWSGIIAGLTLDLDKATATLAELDAERAPLPLAAATGDAAAGKALVAIDRKRQELRQRIDLLGDGLVDARTRYGAAEAAEAADRAAARLEAARGIAGEVMALDRDEIDPLLVRLGQALARRGELVRSLGAHGQLDGSRNRKLRNQTMLLAALHHAGLGAHLPIARIPSHHWTSLEGWDSRWLAGLLPPAANLPPAPEPPPPPPPPTPSGPELDEAAWERLEEREAARSFA